MLLRPPLPGAGASWELARATVVQRLIGDGVESLSPILSREEEDKCLLSLAHAEGIHFGSLRLAVEGSVRPSALASSSQALWEDVWVVLAPDALWMFSHARPERKGETLALTLRSVLLFDPTLDCQATSETDFEVYSGDRVVLFRAASNEELRGWTSAL
jgi:hypothetical protein